MFIKIYKFNKNDYKQIITILYNLGDYSIFPTDIIKLTNISC